MTVGIKGKVKCYNSFYATCLYEWATSALMSLLQQVRLRVTVMENAAARMASFNGGENRDTDQQRGGLLILKMP